MMLTIHVSEFSLSFKDQQQAWKILVIVFPGERNIIT